MYKISAGNVILKERYELLKKEKNINAEFTENTEDAEEFVFIHDINALSLLGVACKNSLN